MVCKTKGFDNEERDIERQNEYQCEEHRVESNFPVDISRSRIEYAKNFEYDQFKHGTRERECDREYKLDNNMMHFVVFEQPTHKK